MSFAALAKVGESMEKPEKYFQQCFMGPSRRCLCSPSGAENRLQFDLQPGILNTRPWMRITPGTHQPYGESKLLFEKILRWYQEIHELNHVVFRYLACGAVENRGQSHRGDESSNSQRLKVALGQRESVEILGTDYPTQMERAFAITFIFKIWPPPTSKPLNPMLPVPST